MKAKRTEKLTKTLAVSIENQMFIKISANLVAKKMTAPTSVQAKYTNLTQKQRIELAERTEVLKQAVQAEINAAVTAAKYELLPALMEKLNGFNVNVAETVSVNVDTITGVDYLKKAKEVFSLYTLEQLLELFAENWAEGSDAAKLAELFLDSEINCKPAPKLAEIAESTETEETEEEQK